MASQYVLASFMNLSSPLSATDRLAMTFDGLCRAVAARSFRGALAGALICLIWSRIRRVERDFLALVARVQAGVVGRRVVGRRGVSGVGRAVSVRVLPRRFGWLLGLVPNEAACFGGQVRTVLEEPEMVAVLMASPQARRILAPLCRMLGIEASVLSPGVVVAPVVARVVVLVKRVRVARAPVDFGRIPLPRGVLAAARRHGFGKRF
jgi:hypothetical protein